MVEEVFIKTDFITLGQFLKLADIVQTGGHVKFFIEENNITVNKQPENRRGKKLYPEDIVEIEEIGTYIIKKS